jgi:tetratricopeptide (TPR) repeat protein
MRKQIWLWPAVGFLTVIVLVVGLFSIASAQSSRDAETLARANQLYENGRFMEAAQTYQQLVDKGISDSTLHYNLGNAYYKQGDLGRAILNYERAAQLKPRDTDIQANLEMSRGQAVDKYNSEGTALLGRLVAASKSILTLSEMAVMALIIWLLLAALFLVYRHARREWLQYALILVALLFMIAAFSLGSRVYLENSRPEAVVLAEEVDVLSGPGAQYVTEFTLHSGAKVSLLENRGKWSRLALPGEQLQGWVAAETIAAVSSP